MKPLHQVKSYKHNGETAKVFHKLQHVMEDEHVIVFYSGVGARVDDLRKQSHWIAHYAAYKVLLKNECCNFVIVEKECGVEYYCNLASPPKMQDNTLGYIDYDIDVILSPNGDVTVHDVDQFNERSASWNYPVELVDALLKKQSEIEAELRERKGYFSEEFYQKLKIIQHGNGQ